MNYLVITNTGLIEAQDLYLIGSSTKRQDETKIGMFGSGWKFALAWLMRNDCLPIILSGEKKIDIDFNVVMHRDNAVRVIVVDGKETSLTSEMGMKWSGWMALREIISNAIDEGGYEIHNLWNPKNFDGEIGKTTIYIPMNNELANVLISYNNYFSFERTVSFENEIGRLYIRKEKAKMSVYRKGIRCYDADKETFSDFDFNEIEIDENRLTQSHFVSNNVSKFIRKGVSTEVLRHLINDNLLSLFPAELNDGITNSLKEFLDIGEVFTCPSLIGLGGMLLIQRPTMTIPNGWFNSLASLGLIPDPFERFKNDTGAPENFIKTNAKNIDGVKYLLEGLNLKYNFVTGLFNKMYQVSENNAYINDDYKASDEQIASDIIYGSSKDFFISQFK